MAEMLKLDNIHKTFNPGTINEKIALNGVNLTLNEGDFVTVIGGNGAGKSTTLNAIAGVWPIDSGKIYIGGDDVTKLSEHKRAKYLGRVFQDPMTGTATTMSIEENMAIAARRGEKRGLSWGITHQERDTYREMLKALDLGLEDRLTSKVGLLSGGQRQRVALGRAMVRDPAVFLLDEPLSNLDAKLRTEMRARIAELHRELGTTFVYVTHDQTEAMTMADRIVVMLDGKIQQADTPAQLYAHPCNVFVAGFIGTPPMNILPGRLVRRGNALDLQVLGTEVALPRRLQNHAKLSTYVDRDVLLGLRAEDLSTDPAWLNITDPAAFRVQVEMAERMGAETYLYADLQGRRVIARVPGTVSFQKDDQTVLYPNMEALHLFDPETEVCICD